MLNILKGVAAIFGLFIGASLISAASPKIGLIVALACLILPVVAMIKPIPRIGLGHRGFSLAVLLLIGLPATFATQEIISNQKEAELAELKTNDPAAYLSVLKESDTDRWLSELAMIAPEQHAVELVRIEKETRRVKKAARLQAEADTAALRQAECGSKNATTTYVMSQALVQKRFTHLVHRLAVTGFENVTNDNRRLRKCSDTPYTDTLKHIRYILNHALERNSTIRPTIRRG